MENTEVFFTSEPMVIGKHEWRVRVVDVWPKPFLKCVRYQWRYVNEEQWRENETYRRENNNMVVNGLAASLQALYERNRKVIHSALREPALSAEQIEQLEIERID